MKKIRVGYILGNAKNKKSTEVILEVKRFPVPYSEIKNKLKELINTEQKINIKYSHHIRGT